MNRGQIKSKIRDRLAEDNTRQIAESFWLDSDLDEYIEEVISVFEGSGTNEPATV